PVLQLPEHCQHGPPAGLAGQAVADGLCVRPAAPWRVGAELGQHQDPQLAPGPWLLTGQAGLRVFAIYAHFCSPAGWYPWPLHRWHRPKLMETGAVTSPSLVTWPWRVMLPQTRPLSSGT